MTTGLALKPPTCRVNRDPSWAPSFWAPGVRFSSPEPPIHLPTHHCVNAANTTCTIRTACLYQGNLLVGDPSETGHMPALSCDDYIVCGDSTTHCLAPVSKKASAFSLPFSYTAGDLLDLASVWCGRRRKTVLLLALLRCFVWSHRRIGEAIVLPYRNKASICTRGGRSFLPGHYCTACGIVRVLYYLALGVSRLCFFLRTEKPVV